MKNISKLSPLVVLIAAFIMLTSLLRTSFADTGVNQFKPGGNLVNTNAAESADIIKPLVVLKSKFTMEKLAWSPDGQYVAAMGRTAEIGIWDIGTQQLVISLQKPADAIAFSPDGRYLVAGLKTISMWDTKTWTHARDLVGPDDIVGPDTDAQHPQPMSVHSISFSPDGGTVAVTYSRPSHGVVVCLFESETGKLIRRIEAEGLTQTGVIFSRDGKKLWGTRYYSTGERMPNGLPVTYLDEHTEIGIWDALSGQKLSTIKDVHVRAPTVFAASPDDRILATGTSTGNIQSTRNMKTGEFRTIINKDPIRLWDANTGHLLRELPVDAHVNSLAFSPDGDFLVSCKSDDAPIWLWQVSTGKLVQEITFPKNHWRDPPNCKFSPDGSKLAAVASFDLAIYSVAR